MRIYRKTEDLAKKFEAAYPEELSARLQWWSKSLGIDRVGLLRMLGMSARQAEKRKGEDLKEILLAIAVNLIRSKPSVPLALVADPGEQPGQFADELTRALIPMSARGYGSLEVKSRLVMQAKSQAAANDGGQYCHDHDGQSNRLATHAANVRC